jgi:hypothetical protein
MGTTAIITAIDKELARLSQVRSLLVEKIEKSVKPGRRSGSTGPARKSGKSRLSPAARARIAEAQRRRWAAARAAKG